MKHALGLIARHGRLGLVAGLIAGLTLPGVALAMRPWLPELIGLLLICTALRIGPRQAVGSLGDLRGSLELLLVLQLGLPLVVGAGLAAMGMLSTPVALALILFYAAPSVTGSPNFAILLGQAPAPALRLLVLGTAIFPMTVLPVFWLLPVFDGAGAALGAAGALMAVILGAVAAGFALRHWVLPAPDAEMISAIDGVSVILLSVVVVGLMSALGPALSERPITVLGWLALAFALNWGTQIVAYAVLRARADRGPVAIVAGNRNIALFLIALPEGITDPLLIFIGCYQIPMYLTPVLLGWLYGHAEG